MMHVLKQAEIFFDASVSGQKPFEIRSNDRDYQVGDSLLLRELNTFMVFTGRWALMPVTFVLRESMWGMKDDYLIMGLGSCMAKGDDNSWMESMKDQIMQDPFYVADLQLSEKRKGSK